MTKNEAIELAIISINIHLIETKTPKLIERYNEAISILESLKDADDK